MANSLASFVRKMETRTVVISGTTFEVRALSTAETDRIRRCMPPPHLAKDDDGAISAANVELRSAWERRLTRGLLAVSLDWVDASGAPCPADEAHMATWLSKAAAEIAHAFTQVEINRLVRAGNEADDGGPITGNSLPASGMMIPGAKGSGSQAGT